MYGDSSYRGYVSAWLQARHIQVVIPRPPYFGFYARGSLKGTRRR
jgi:hypothetical protein